MFSVTCTLFSYAVSYSIVFVKSSLSISALVLSDNDDVPQYTASAPYLNAVFAFQMILLVLIVLHIEREITMSTNVVSEIIPYLYKSIKHSNAINMFLMNRYRTRTIY